MTLDTKNIKCQDTFFKNMFVTEYILRNPENCSTARVPKLFSKY